MREYTVEGPVGEITVQLSDEEAADRGLKPHPPAPKAATPENKAATPPNKATGTAAKRTQAAQRSFGQAKRR